VSSLNMIETLGPIQSHPEHSIIHHSPGGFRNPWPLDEAKPGPLDALGWMLSFPFKLRDDSPPAFVSLTRQQIEHDVSRRSAYWIGHSTVLLKLSGKYILVDPVFADRVSPVAFAGPKREVPLPIRVQDLPAVDLVIVSHNHYDHLDSEAIADLAGRFDPLFVAPLGNADLLRMSGATRIIEMDWWQFFETGGFRIHCLPARHFSNRGLTDRNRSLWGSFLVEDAEWKMYFAGDTGYADHFVEIGRKFGPIDLALIPIGAYLPRWFMREVHMDPVEAMQAFDDLKAREFFGIHWGTFVLAEEPLHDPKDLIESLIIERSLDRSRFHLLDIGGAVQFHANDSAQEASRSEDITNQKVML